MSNSTSTDSSFYSEEDDDSFYSDDDDYMYGMGGMYGGPVQVGPPSREDYNADPSRDRTSIFLGELSLPVKACKGYTIDHLKQRLVPDGLRYTPGRSMEELCLDNLFNVSGGSLHRPKYLTFDVPEVEAPAADANETQIIEINVLRPGYPMSDMLVELPNSCSIAEARASITQQLQPQLPNAPQAVVLLWRNDGADGGMLVTAAADDDERFDVCTIDPSHPRFKQKELLVCWLPKAPDAKGKQPATPAGEAEQHYAKQYALLQHMRYSRRTEYLQLLPLPDDCVSGGKRQHGVLQEKLLQLLDKHCKYCWRVYRDNQSPPDVHLLRTVHTSGSIAGSYCPNNTPRTNAASFAKPGGQLTWLCQDLIAQLYVEGQNVLGDHYNLGLRVDQSPAQTALAYERDFRRDAEADRRLRQQRRKLLRRLPLYDVLSELRAAAQRVHPEFSYMGNTRPAVAVRLALECPDPERKRHGVATLKVRIIIGRI
ncbi:hypothetical protein OEZ86_000763 [Tetradesmus obliquus]|nr:hypothetical protein OEZ86_000763 [Tetradesmus obliquus]